MARKNVPLRIDPGVYDAIARWAADEARSVNAQMEVMLRDALRRAGRLPRNVGDLPRRGRPKGTSSAAPTSPEDAS
ncbi:hypothetical protein ACUY3K_06230 [Corynebacterium uberis]|uniref:hypothetical protein n=1 Tax=Corynebacterium TaxID=1716 RepID=UPI001D0B6C37|nr:MULTISPECIES: hypothetical protein [Corynebacterium]MCZ9309766.1 hypothetical protein [Corynebacterium sp. c6VSa_13]UDL73568.1 hypothetical protein LH391_10905 [Corynebacterium uberis]UDL75552.1 hypothetical protein LH393_10020 [Corynebacterium uberis]UDL77765.1 hypothetical protein LH394_10005 [Corynebacterium uberis]UDL80048.1 hypothetical protein LH392_10425 [Corynebacterium uberis]